MASDVSSTIIESSSKSKDSHVKLVREASLVAMYSAVAVASSLVLVTIPNLETITLFIFLVSYRHGFWRGLNMAILTLILYEFVVASVWGSAGFLFLFKFPPQFLTVLLGFLSGRVLREQGKQGSSVVQADKTLSNSISYIEKTVSKLMDVELEKKNRSFNVTVESITFGILGFTITLIYDIFTSLSFLIFTPEIRSESLLVAFLLGVPFYLFHELTNFFLFSTIPVLNEALDAVSKNGHPRRFS